MSTLASMSQKVAEKYAGPNSAFDPSIIVVIAELLVPLIEVLQQCFTPAETIQRAKTPSLRERVAVRLMVRRQLGWSEYRSLRGENLVEALFETAAESSEDEMSSLFAEVNG